MTQPLPIHAESCPDPAELRWMVPAGILTGVGTVLVAPEPLEALRREGLLDVLVAEPAAVRMRLAAERSWRTEGAAVRTALQEALRSPAEWVFAGDAGADDLLAAAARAVLAGPVGDFVRSHGGIIEFDGAHDGVLTLRVGGTCADCPALGWTLQARVERAVRRLCPELRSVVHKPLRRRAEVS